MESVLKTLKGRYGMGYRGRLGVDPQVCARVEWGGDCLVTEVNCAERR